MTFDKIGLKVPRILLPEEGVDMSKWAVIACDQYTSDPEYWEQVRREVGDSPSTLDMVLPEVYLEDSDVDQRIADINRAMRQALEDGTLVEQPPGFILVDRQTSEVPSRKGLMVALDLECYDYSADSRSLIRATEGTILERLPPRIKVRRNAPIELPHIMVLIDDPDRTVIEPLFEKKGEKVYDFPLMLDGGHLSGWHISDRDDVAEVAASLERLAEPSRFEKRYGVTDKEVLLYAMGDGNHSFATAKAIWEDLKDSAADKEAIMSHPARWALVELVNVHDPGLEFEAIHRVVFNADLDAMAAAASAYCAQMGGSFRLRQCSSRAAQDAAVEEEIGLGRHAVAFVAAEQRGVFIVENSPVHLVVATLQGFLDAYLESVPEAKIDYIHGEDAVENLGGKAGNVGFFLPSISKHELFKTIVLDGALPRKTFSMGEADEKRFYVECRRILP